MEYLILFGSYSSSEFFMSIFIILVIVGTICEVHTKMIEQNAERTRYWYGDNPSQDVIIEQNTEPDSTPMTEEDWNVICRTAIEKAKNGDGKSRDWITKHMSSNEGSSLENPSVKSSPLEADAVSALVNVGIKKKEAVIRVSQALSRRSYSDLDSLIKDAFSGK